MRPLILITNDDGVLSPGIKAAAEAVYSLGDLLIVAPRYEQSAMGRSYPKGDDNGIIEEMELELNGKKQKAYGVHGSPAQAVSHGILELASRTPDLCISGVNYGENIGLNLIPSGTLGAAFEANTYDIPAIAVSQEVNLEIHHSREYQLKDWKPAKYFTLLFARKVLESGLPKEIGALNVNLPASANEHTKIKRTTQSRQNYFKIKKPNKRAFSKPYEFSVDLIINESTLERTSDIKAIVFDKVVSVTPLGWDLTANTEWGKEYDF